MSIRIPSFMVLCAALGGVACVGEPPTSLLDKPRKAADETVGDTPDKQGGRPQDTMGGEEGTFDHMPNLGADEARDPLEIAKQREEEGSPEVRSRLHSCQKLQIAAIRNILVDFGVDLEATGDPRTAGQLLAEGETALGAANYPARMGEDLVWTAAGAAKQFDIFVQAAPEIIAAMPTLPHCMKEGAAAGPQVFEADGSCNRDAVTCLIGRPATDDHLAICKSLVQSASNPDKGKSMAVATLLAAAHSCE
jgi:hypothetical protein